jgi:TetR/AcrR family transcriptional repressor of nem operon
MARPRTFDEEQVLDAICECFWAKGYEATSIDDLMDATGLGKGSLYGAFGGKHELFVRVFGDYCTEVVADVRRELEGSDAGAYKRLRAHVRAMAASSAAKENRRGCLLARATAEVADRDPEIAQIALRAFEGIRQAIVTCIEQAQRHGDIPAGADAGRLAGMLLAVLRGMESLGKAGMDSGSLRAIADTSLAALTAA